MNKNKKRIIIVSFFIITVFIFLYFDFSKIPPPVTPEVIVETKISTDTLSKDISQEKYVSLQVLDKIYKAPITSKDTVYDVMKKLQSVPENHFSFKYKEYSSMGIFVNEINGIEGSPGKYWIYYVNGVEASVSVSKNIIKEGDIITWKQE